MVRPFNFCILSHTGVTHYMVVFLVYMYIYPHDKSNYIIAAELRSLLTFNTGCPRTVRRQPNKIATDLRHSWFGEEKRATKFRSLR